MLHRLGFDYRKPEAMPRGLDDAKQQAFIDQYENLLNTMGADEAVLFVDAVHPTHQVRRKTQARKPDSLRRSPFRHVDRGVVIPEAKLGPAQDYEPETDA